MSRDCGTCTACCHSLVVEELEKPAFSKCVHSCEAMGCSAYYERPDSCRNFRCLWLDGHLGDADRPDQLGVIFTTTVHENIGVHPLLVETTPGGIKQPRVLKAIEGLTTQGPVLVLTKTGGTFHPQQPVRPHAITVNGHAA